jgi:hypothetical protein
VPTVNPKVTAATLAAAITTLAVGVFNLDLSAEEQGALTTILVFAAGFLKRS